MGAQAFVMMYQAGEGWQYGKRKQSAMSNEDFNKQTLLSIMQNQSAILRTALPTIEKSMNDMTPMIATIVEQYGDFIREIIKAIPQALENVTTEPSGALGPPKGVAGFITPIIPSIASIRELEAAQKAVVQPTQSAEYVALLNKLNRKKAEYEKGLSVYQRKSQFPTTNQAMIASEQKLKRKRENISWLQNQISHWRNQQVLLEAQLRLTRRGHPRKAKMDREHRKLQILIDEASRSLGRLR